MTESFGPHPSRSTVEYIVYIYIYVCVCVCACVCACGIFSLNIFNGKFTSAYFIVDLSKIFVSIGLLLKEMILKKNTIFCQLLSSPTEVFCGGNNQWNDKHNDESYIYIKCRKKNMFRQLYRRNIFLDVRGRIGFNYKIIRINNSTINNNKQ